MKLRNRETGEIGRPAFISADYKIVVLPEDKTKPAVYYDSLAKLYKEWEDYEEPKSYYYIADFGAIREGDVGKFVEDEESRKEIGNYFETREEAEKAVEKLKAWKRLKDYGFKFTGWDRHPDFDGDFRITASDDWNCDDKDLDLLLGGEE